MTREPKCTVHSMTNYQFISMIFNMNTMKRKQTFDLRYVFPSLVTVSDVFKYNYQERVLKLINSWK